MDRTRSSRRIISSCNQLPNFLNPNNRNCDLAHLVPARIYRQLIGKPHLTCLTLLNLNEILPCHDFEQEYEQMKRAANKQIVENPESIVILQKKLSNFTSNKRGKASELKQELNQRSTYIDIEDLLTEQQFLLMLDQLIFRGFFVKSERIATHLQLQN